MKRLFPLLLLLCLILSMSMLGTSCSQTTLHGMPKLSAMTDEECAEFLRDAGCPVVEDATEEHLAFLKELIIEIENDPGICWGLSWSDLQDSYDRIRVAVNTYYGLSLDHGSSGVYQQYYTEKFADVVENATILRERVVE